MNRRDDASGATMRAALSGGLIVSCQALPHEPLRDPRIMAAMAAAAVMGGAVAIRANGPDDVRAIREAVEVPIFGLLKRRYPDSPVYITPTLDDVRRIAEAGCDVIAVDATDQPRPNGEALAAFLGAIKRELRQPLMADVSTLAEGIRAADLGADLVATTLAGYTPYSRQQTTPDLLLVEELAARVTVPIVAEGRFTTPDQARQALARGALAVVVGSMITRPTHITAHFVAGMRRDPSGFPT
jgi:N-acylglucosamine-6-phosphate 2-epimerase